MMPRALLLALVALAPALAGCADPAQEPAPAELAVAMPERAVMDWSPGNWWAYHATIENVSFDVAIIVHESGPQGYRLGTNLSAGFFGLPWTGNVTLDRNPRIGADTWVLFDPPLADGKEWSYPLLGYQAKTVARAATIALPDGVGRPGFQMEASAYGRLFARYDHVEEVAWFTRLQLIEPTDGHVVLDARLTAFGTDWDEAYFVEETVREVEIGYPALPGALEIEIPAGYLQLRAILTAQASPGAADASLRDGAGRLLAAVRALPAGADVERTSARSGDGDTWTLEHAGVGAARVHLEVTGLSATGPLAAAAPPPLALDLGELLQSTRPAYPQAGQTTSTAPPLALRS